MSTSNHKFAITGVDKSGAAFSSIQARAIAAGNRIRAAMGGALAAAGAYLSLRKVADGVNELGRLSDLAMKAGTSVEELTQAATAFQVAGLNLSVDTLAKSFQYLEKNTGKTGMQNFLAVASTIAKIEDPVKRGTELMANFGRGIGMEFQALIDGGDAAIERFRRLAAVMPSVSQSAADAGDAVADSLTIFGSGAHNLMLKIIGNIAAMWSEDLPGGVRAGALNAINYIEYFVRRAGTILTQWGTKIGLALQAMWNFATNDYTWEQAWSEYGELAEIVNANFDAQLAKMDANRQHYVETLKTLTPEDLAGQFRGAQSAANSLLEGAAKRAVRVVNTMITGGSNAQRRLEVLGPTMESESKKQTRLQEQILSAVNKVANSGSSSTGETTYDMTDVGA